jgi:hypothetical protein
MFAARSEKFVRATWLMMILPICGQVSAAEVSAISSVVAPSTTVSGRTQGEWSVAWWQWAYAFDEEDSPLADSVGDKCAAGQSGPIWFLAGVFGSRPVKRHCIVPAGKYLFFPIVNYSVIANARMSSCESVTATAKELIDGATNLTLIVDGEELRNLKPFRQVSPRCFNVGERANRNYFPTAANGYFVMLKPLSPGKHTIKWGGEVSGRLRQAVVYELTVTD